MNESELNAQIERARVNWAIDNALEPRAKSIAYDRKAEELIILATDGTIYHISPRILEGLQDAPLENIQDFYISADGSSIHWELLDVDFSIPGIIAGRFGSEGWMNKIGKQP